MLPSVIVEHSNTSLSPIYNSHMIYVTVNSLIVVGWVLFKNMITKFNF